MTLFQKRGSHNKECGRIIIMNSKLGSC